MMRKQLQIRTASLVLCCIAAGSLLSGCKTKQVVLESGAEESRPVTAELLGGDGNVNFTLPEKGEEIVVMTIENYGDVKIKLFPEESEKGVENFKELVRSGYYDELLFHRVIDGFVVQGGDPKGDGTGGADAWGSSEGFAQTISGKLNHVTGAVAYATANDHLNKSQFYIVTGEKHDNQYFSSLRDGYGKSFTPMIQSMYEAVGGDPDLDGDYEVFGQVFDGMDYCLEIQKVAVDANKKPKSAVRIEKAVVTEYDGAAPHYVDAEGGAISLDAAAGLNDEG